MTASRFASEVASTAVFAGVILALQGTAALALSWGGVLLPLFGIMAGIILVASGMALSQHKAWGRTAIEVAAWMGLVLGISAVGIYLWAEIPFDPTETVEMQEAGRFGVALAIAGLLAWTVTVAWIIRGLRRADLRDILRA